MKVNILTDNYKVIDAGSILLFNENSDMKIELTTDSSFTFTVVLQFIMDETQNKFLKKEVDSNTIFFKCYNFNKYGTGTTEPISIATIDDKEWYLHFWSMITGNCGPRKVEYSILEKE